MSDTDKKTHDADEAFHKLYCLIAMEEIIKECAVTKDYTPKAQYLLKARVDNKLRNLLNLD